MISPVRNPSAVFAASPPAGTQSGRGPTLSVTQRQQDTVEISQQAQKAAETTEKTTGKDGDGDGH